MTTQVNPIQNAAWPVATCPSLQYRGRYRIIDETYARDNDGALLTLLLGGFLCDGYRTEQDAQNEHRIPRNA